MTTGTATRATGGAAQLIPDLLQQIRSPPSSTWTRPPPRMDRAALRKLLRRNRIEWVRREYPDIGICHYTSWLRRHVPPDAWAEARPTGIHIFTTAGLVAVAVPIRRTTHTFTHPDGRTMTENRYEDTELSES